MCCNIMEDPGSFIARGGVILKKSKLSFYYRKMQRSFLFPNIYITFEKKDQVFSDFPSKI